jgi:bifunctional non-homologous end joining protein LigD
MLWDRGTYEAEDGGGEESLREGYERGDLKFVLHGERLQGGWVLVRMRRAGPRAQWLLIKHRDEYATKQLDVTETVQTSVTTGRTMDQIATGRSRVWNSNRAPVDEPAAETKRPASVKRGAKKRSATAGPAAKRRPTKKRAAR